MTVHCSGLVATTRLNVIAPPATPAPPPASTPTPPPASPPSTPASAATQTQVTVANVCGLNPALGPIHYTTSSEGWPTAYWTDGSGSKLTLMAFSDDGDNKVDIAAVFGADGQSIAYFAHCDWSSWLTVAQFEAAQTQQGVSSSQASSLSYLLQEENNNAIFEEESDWFQPAAGWQVCPGDAPNMCDFEPVD